MWYTEGIIKMQKCVIGGYPIYANCGSKSVMIFGSQATDFSQWWLTDYYTLVICRLVRNNEGE